ncbi:MAG: CD1247 N-terminal domain-containing protein [Candidatus Ventricola sp.]
MSKMGEKVAYLKGLAEGMRLDAGSDQGKLLLAMIDAMEAFASEHEDTCAQLDELQQYVEEIDSDVSDLEEALFSEDEDDDEDEEDDGEDDDDEDGDGLIEYECPHCGTVVFFDEEAFDMEDKHLCPNCHRSIFDDEDSFDEDDNAEGDDDGEDE